MPLQSDSMPVEYHNLVTKQSLTFDELRKLYPNTSFTKQIQEFDGWVAVYSEAPPVVERYQTAFRDGVQQINGKWFTKYSVADMDDAAKAAVDAAQAASVRATRNSLLSGSDWTQLADFPVQNRDAWASYRQDLRDLPLQTGFPWNVVWPQRPQ